MELKKYTLENEHIKFAFTNLGARWIEAKVKDGNGEVADVLQAYENLDDFHTYTNAYGAICGRVANRIANAQFSLNGQTYQLSENVPGASLHGGAEGFQTKLWTTVAHSPEQLIFEYRSPDGEGGYPGNAIIKVTYSLYNQQSLKIDLEAETDQACPINLAAHPYFNLAGHDAGHLDHHLFQIHANEILTMNEYLVVNEEPQPVLNTVFDLRQPQSIQDRLISDDAQIQIAGGFDHNFILKGYGKSESSLAAEAYDTQSGRYLRVYTSLPGLQFYTCNSDNPQPAKDKVKYKKWGSFCMEPQYFPNSPNVPSFPNSIVQPGEKMKEIVVYEFGQK